MHAGKLTLVGAGVVSGVWLLVKAFSGGSNKAKSKHKKKHQGKHKPQPDSFDDYAGFDGYEEEDDHDQELDSLASAYHSPEYAYDHADRFQEGDEDGFPDGEDDGFYSEGTSEDADGDYARYEFDDQRGPAADTAYDDEDDNGLSAYPDFPAHSGAQHGEEAEQAQSPQAGAAGQGPAAVYADVYHTDEDHGYDEGPAHSFASAHSYQARPYDDSRRLPESNSFADLEEDEEPAQSKAASGRAKRLLVPTLVAFAKSEMGKVIMAQVAAVAMAYAGKKLKDILPGNAAETGKNADLAASSATEGAPPVSWPATTAAQDAAAAPLQNDALTASLTAREPLA